MAVELALIDLDPIVAQLATAGAGVLRDVGLAADFAAVTAPGAVVGSPSAFVICTNAEPLPVKEASSLLNQQLIPTVSVLVAVKLAGRRGADGRKAIEQPANVVRAALFGFKHPDAETKFVSAGEGLEDFNTSTGVLVYRLDFLAPFRIQELN